ncbi:hypothetical protein L6164_021022 [Bauhinia variegata]|uniref:Uncharacterized protein n=1 Tax=Bauhinia variegata TaxID=167791 RepID=A0ACB9MX63_BAUVA|nr:hypothetical protein L6164_021022 [Bauhinia variegata]
MVSCFCRNLDNNNLTGSLPSQLLEKSLEGSLVLSNKNNSSNNKKRNIIVPLVASLGGILILLVAVAVLFVTLQRRNSKYVKEEAYVHDTSLQARRRQYSYSDIINMTNNFNRVLGKGGFGAVYLDYIDDTWVAVKMLSPSSVQGYQQFEAEVRDGGLYTMTLH